MSIFIDKIDKYHFCLCIVLAYTIFILILFMTKLYLMKY